MRLVAYTKPSREDMGQQNVLVSLQQILVGSTISTFNDTIGDELYSKQFFVLIAVTVTNVLNY